jgi:hypothetical protein
MTMLVLNQALLILHFLGLALGLSVPLANMVMGGLIAKAAPPDKAVLGRFPPLMGRVGKVGLALLWVTGLSMVNTKYAGFASLPWRFYAKLTAVILLTLTVGYVDVQERATRKGDVTALGRIERAGKLAAVFALIAVIFAVITFN